MGVSQRLWLICPRKLSGFVRLKGEVNQIEANLRITETQLILGKQMKNSRSDVSLYLTFLLCFLVAACDQDRSHRPTSERGDSRSEEVFRESQLKTNIGQSLIISEFMAINDSTLKDEDGDYSDWIEILNYGEAPVDLLGWALTDDEREPMKWRFPEGTLRPGEHLLVFASGKKRHSVGELHCSFKLSSKGEFLGLRSPDGQFVHQFLPRYHGQYRDVSYGIAPSWNSDRGLSEFEGALLRATPAGVNTELAIGQVEPVEFSHPPGIQRESVPLAFS